MQLLCLLAATKMVEFIKKREYAVATLGGPD